MQGRQLVVPAQLGRPNLVTHQEGQRRRTVLHILIRLKFAEGLPRLLVLLDFENGASHHHVLRIGVLLVQAEFNVGLCLLTVVFDLVQYGRRAAYLVDKVLHVFPLGQGSPVLRAICYLYGFVLFKIVNVQFFGR